MLTTDDLDVHELKSDFGFLNRFIGNYLTRIAKGSGYISEDYNRIVIIAQTGDIKRPYIEDKFLKIEVGFNREEYN